MIAHIATLLWNTRRTGVLLTAQILLAFLILFGVFAFAGSKIARYVTPLGFATEDAFIVYLKLPQDLLPEAVAALCDRLRGELASVDGVAAVSLTSGMLPFNDWTWQYTDNVDGVEISTYLSMVDEHFADAAQLELVEGRWFIPEDTLGGKMGVVVNNIYIAENFPHGDVVGKTFVSFEGITTTIVGVVRNYKYLGEFADEGAITFLPRNPFDPKSQFTQLYVRADSGAPATIERAIADRVAEVTRTRESIIERVEARREDTSRETWVPILTLLGICAFLIINVALGLFGILINAIARRRGEIGLRKAMGATGLDITAQFTLEVVLIAALGIALGSLVAVQVPLFELIELETRYFWWGGVLAAALIFLIVLLCALIPSSQAARVHPAVALREE